MISKNCGLLEGAPVSSVTRVKLGRSGAAVTVRCRVGVAGRSVACVGKASELGAMQHYHRLASDVNLEEE
eukprot:5026586-Prymnesium_polylepis.1